MQHKDTESARATLKEAMAEIELIAVEKREYLLKWKSSLVGQCYAAIDPFACFLRLTRGIARVGDISCVCSLTMPSHQV